METNSTLLQFAEANGLSCDSKGSIASGRYHGYFTCITMNESKQFYAVFGLKSDYNSEPVRQSELDRLTTENNSILSIKQDNFQITVLFKAGISIKSSIEKMEEGLQGIIRYFDESRLKDCCGKCGMETEVSAYLINSEASDLCSQCLSDTERALNENQANIRHRKGSMLTGIVGAILGSLIGIAAFVLINQLGYFAAISGLIMAVCTLKGFELLGGKINALGIIVCCVIMVIMVCIGVNISWSMDIANEFKNTVYNVSMFEVFRSFYDFFTEGLLEIKYYLRDLGLAYVFTVIGAVPTILQMFRSSTGAYEIKKVN